MINEKVRARVLKVEDTLVTLGIYVMNTWTRVVARTNIQLLPKSWIVGHLIVQPDGSEVFFKVLEVEPPSPEDMPAMPDDPPQQTPSGGIDFSA